jgi:hypothetical protein
MAVFILSTVKLSENLRSLKQYDLIADNARQIIRMLAFRGSAETRSRLYKYFYGLNKKIRRAFFWVFLAYIQILFMLFLSLETPGSNPTSFLIIAVVVAIFVLGPITMLIAVGIEIRMLKLDCINELDQLTEA